MLRESAKEYSKNQETSEKLINRLKTLTESADRRITDIQRNAHDFQHEVVDRERKS